MDSNRKAAMVILGLAVSAFVIDRAFLGGGFGPQSASAGASVFESTAEVTATPVQAQPPHPLDGVADAFEDYRTANLAEADEVRDVFDASGLVRQPEAPSIPSAIDPAPQRAMDAFARANRLTSAVGRVIILNNAETWRVGDTDENGFTLVRIEMSDKDVGNHTRAVFSYEDRELELTLR